jgi:hypothetical protein
MDDCALCAEDVETLDHLLVVSLKTWFQVLRFFGLGSLAPSKESPLAV